MLLLVCEYTVTVHRILANVVVVAAAHALMRADHMRRNRHDDVHQHQDDSIAMPVNDSSKNEAEALLSKENLTPEA